ncbi:hypothetical protein [Devosia salina]|nr:hypothetical protein [Devosia salina]
MSHSPESATDRSPGQGRRLLNALALNLGIALAGLWVGLSPAHSP